MGRLFGILVAVWLALGALLGQSAIHPQPASACSCAPTTLADYAGDPQASVFAGTVGQQVGGRIPVAVAAWYKGANPSDLVWLAAASQPDGRGGVIFDTCGLTIEPGESWLLVVYGGPPEPYSASNCAPSVPLQGELGAAGLAQAEALFGPGKAPPTVEPLPDLTIELSNEPVLWGWLLGGGLAAATILLGAALLARHRRPLS